ncbi:MAG: hypothetical protein QNK80_00100, partial [Akkermansiaceae bacterium]
MSDIREITEAELPAELKDHWKSAKASVERKNPGYAVKFLQAILKQEPGFLNARKLLRQAEINETGASPGSGKKGLFGTSGGGGGTLARASKKDPVAALVAIEKELEKDPFNGAINDVLHDTCLKVNLLSTAAFALETAKKGNPENTKLSHKLANFYILRDMHAEAAIVYQDIVRQDQSDGAAIKGEKDCSAKASMQKNNLSESSSFRDIIKSDEAAELEMASRSALTKDQLLEKVGILAAKYQEDPNNLNVVKDLAATYEQLEDWASAQQFFDWAHQVSGGDVALRSKAEAMGDKSKALGIADLEAQAAADPDNADLQSQLVEIKAGRLDERLVECKQRVDQNPTDPKLRYELGYAFYDAGKHSEAIPHLQQATRNPHIRTKVL